MGFRFNLEVQLFKMNHVFYRQGILSIFLKLMEKLESAVRMAFWQHVNLTTSLVGLGSSSKYLFEIDMTYSPEPAWNSSQSVLCCIRDITSYHVPTGGDVPNVAILLCWLLLCLTVKRFNILNYLTRQF